MSITFEIVLIIPERDVVFNTSFTALGSSPPSSISLFKLSILLVKLIVSLSNLL